jgi:hypothetical protein
LFSASVYIFSFQQSLTLIPPLSPYPPSDPPSAQSRIKPITTPLTVTLAELYNGAVKQVRATFVSTIGNEDFIHIRFANNDLFLSFY